MSALPQIISDSALISGASETLASNMLAALELHYPTFGGLWRVSVDEIGGTVTVTNMALSGRWGFMMHTSKVDPEMRKVVRAGGELLERFRVSRAKIVRPESILALPRNYRGDFIPQT